MFKPPLSIVALLVNVIAAVPASRFAEITPFAAVSLATNVKFPPSVEIMALLIAIDRPACNVNAPPFPLLMVGLELLTIISSLTVISLFACSVNAVPVSRMLVILNGVIEDVKLGSVVNVCPAAGAVPALSTIMFFGSNNNLPLLPCGADKFTLPSKINCSLPDTSAKPPLPDAPPFA